MPTRLVECNIENLEQAKYLCMARTEYTLTLIRTFCVQPVLKSSEMRMLTNRKLDILHQHREEIAAVDVSKSLNATADCDNWQMYWVRLMDMDASEPSKLATYLAKELNFIKRKVEGDFNQQVDAAIKAKEAEATLESLEDFPDKNADTAGKEAAAGSGSSPGASAGAESPSEVIGPGRSQWCSID